MIKEIKKYGKLTKTKTLKNTVLIKTEADENDGDYVNSEDYISLEDFADLLRRLDDLKTKYGIKHNTPISELYKGDLSDKEVDALDCDFEDFANQVDHSEKTLSLVVFDNFIPFANYDGGDVHGVCIDIIVYDENGIGYNFNLKQ